MVAGSSELVRTLKHNTAIDDNANSLIFNNANTTNKSTLFPYTTLFRSGQLTNNGNVKVVGNDTITNGLTVSGPTWSNEKDNATGLSSGSLLYSLVTIDADTGAVHKRNVNALLSAIHADNGLTTVAENIE